jgi:sterol desaturase/sphingolipid hydroxylase (fatty acid hydroxylase superfamily)
MISLLSANGVVILYVFTLAIMWTWESIAPFFQNPRDKVRHDLRNLFLGAVNAIVLGVVFAGITDGFTGYVSENRIGVIFLLAPAWWLHCVLAFLALDCWLYNWHRLNHCVPFFWRFHRMHHSDNAMDATSAARFHFGEIAISMVLRVPIIALFGVPMFIIVLYDIVLLVTTMFHHANIALPDKFDRVIRFVTPSPFMHKIHHSRFQPETDSNFSSVLSMWDRIFGTYREKDNYGSIEFGLKEFDAKDKQNLAGLFATPFR